MCIFIAGCHHILNWLSAVSSRFYTTPTTGSHNCGIRELRRLFLRLVCQNQRASLHSKPTMSKRWRIYCLILAPSIKTEPPPVTGSPSSPILNLASALFRPGTQAKRLKPPLARQAGLLLVRDPHSSSRTRFHAKGGHGPCPLRILWGRGSRLKIAPHARLLLPLPPSPL